jgi:hypothetical protein
MGDIRTRNQYHQLLNPSGLIPGALLAWPVSRTLSRRHETLLVKDLGPRPLPALLCEQWEQQKTPEFNQLILQPVASESSLSRRWSDRFNQLGHTRDILVELSGVKVQLYRPVCTDNGKAYLCFFYLHHPAE